MNTTPTKAKHTATPWHCDGFLILSNDHNPRIVATVAHDQQGLRRGHETNEANAELICTAVNAHQELVALVSSYMFHHGPRNAEEIALEKKARALLSKLGGTNE